MCGTVWQATPSHPSLGFALQRRAASYMSEGRVLQISGLPSDTRGPGWVLSHMDPHAQAHTQAGSQTSLLRVSFWPGGPQDSFLHNLT